MCAAHLPCRAELPIDLTPPHKDDALCQKNQVGAGILPMGTHKVSGVY